MPSLRTRVKSSPALRTVVFLAQNASMAVRGTGRTAKEWPGTPRYNLTAMVRVKDESRFLPEWVAHHLNLGVEHFYVYDNNSTDDLGTVLGPFREAGLVTYIPWETVPISPSSHLDFLDRFGSQTRWVAFFDADEFLVESHPGEALKVLEGCESAPAVAINWRYFGSAGHEVVPPGLITENFDQADVVLDDHVKVIIQPSRFHRYRNPHNFYYRGGRLAVTPEHKRTYGTFVTPAAAPRLTLNHYVYRSRWDFDRKSRGGFDTARGGRASGRHLSRSDIEFDRHNETALRPPSSVVRSTAATLQRFGFPSELYGSSSATTGHVTGG